MLTDVEQRNKASRQKLLSLWQVWQWPIFALGIIAVFIWSQWQQEVQNLTINQQQQQAAQLVALDQQHETALQNYLQTISDLMAHDKLLQAPNGDAARTVAQARTYEIFRTLDPARKATVLRFLNETRLINNDYHIVALTDVDAQKASLAHIDLSDTALTGCLLKGADLQGANLSNATLIFVNFQGANLQGADLHSADMHNVDLTGANLQGANLKDVQGLNDSQLARAKSLAGATMPNGSLHS
ncbi:pentapeptide repeat-containing protein [Tengunoibacter tsumagoiensis]|uniref:Pentapeptide repeat-containing protein n=1 Tax=Tengunoibacter tsumagoiensis TaxID=2014871 RepID=A0A401ZVM7_9CHLR|nr:pentapeptide repeat-containing protein [Tengunoibacter tsumagoiensis]GCE10959.1 hypothetical protein KTT_08180 [Tengunoibacter tsumagoiensis]